MAKTEFVKREKMETVLDLLTPPNRLVMRVCLHTGLRVGDVLLLKPDDLKPNTWITEQKTGKRRQIGFPEPLLRDLRAYCGKYWVFPGRNPIKHRSRQAVWKDVKRAAYAMRLPQNIGTHTARKVYAVEQFSNTGDLAKVQRLLNHSSIEVTLLYAMADKLNESRRQRKKCRKKKSRY